MSMFGFRVNECFMQQGVRDLNTRTKVQREHNNQKLTIESTALCFRTTEMASIGYKPSTFDSHQLMVRNDHVWLLD